MIAKYRKLLPIIGCVGALTSVNTARADDDLEALLATSIESTSGKAAGTSDAAPALSINVTAEDLRRHGITTLAQAYNFLTMGLVAQDPLGDPDIGSRGVIFPADRGKHVLLLLDGHTLNDHETGASFHGAGLGVPMELIDHVEIALGPGSVLYGANAMFGVINVITKRAKDARGVQVVAEAAFSPPLNRAHEPLGPGSISPYLSNIGHTYRLAAIGGYEFKLGKTPAELTAGLEYQTFVGPTLTFETQTGGPIVPWGGRASHSYYQRSPAAYVRLFAGEFEVSARAVQTRLSAPYVRRDFTPSDTPDFDDPDSYKDRLNVNLDLKWHHIVSDVTSLSARVYGDNASNSGRFRTTIYYGCFSPFKAKKNEPCLTADAGYARSVGSELQGTFDWNRDNAFVTMIGVDGRVRQVGYENGFSSVPTGQHEQFSKVDRFEQAAAVYAQHLYRVSQWLTLNAGARWDFDSNFGNHISPRAAVIAKPWREGTLKAIYSEALRAPTTDEQTYRDPSVALPSLHLEPESVRSVEAILQQRFGSQSLVFGIFRSWWTNMVVRHELNNHLYQTSPDSETVRAAQRNGLLVSNISTAYQYQNIGSIDDFGFNGGYDGTLLSHRLAYGFNVTAAYARSRTARGTRLMTVTPSWFGNARISYDFAGDLPVLALAAHFGGKRLADAGEDAGFRPLPYASGELDLKVAVTGPFPLLKQLSYRVTGDYSTASSNPYTAGRVKTVEQGSAPQLIPVNRLTLMVGLQYNLFQ